MTEAELLFTEILNCDRLSLYRDRNLCLDKDKSALISSVLKRRILGEPLEYILGKTEFIGLEFKVDKNVFIPRQDTEILVEAVIKFSSLVPRPSSLVTILELGTGSGCIAVSLAKFIPNVKVIATDISREAINIAEENAILNNVTGRIKFIHSDLFTEYGIRNTEYDLIVSNPPYVPAGEIEFLEPGISYEPRIALDGGADGLDFYRRIVNEALRYLKKNGFLIMEIGFGQKEAIENIFKKQKNLEIIEAIKDYNKIYRVILVKKINLGKKRWINSLSRAA